MYGTSKHKIPQKTKRLKVKNTKEEKTKVEKNTKE